MPLLTMLALALGGRRPGLAAPADDEAALVRRAQGDPAAFAPLYETYFPRIYGYCRRRTGQPEDAEDLTSLVFTRALQGLGGYRGGSVGAWLFGIAHNAVANHLRDHRPVAWLADEVADELADPAGSGEQMLAALVQAEERQRLARLIAALPDEQRELLALKVSGGLAAREIGAVLGKSEGAVRVALHRLVQQLRASYQRAEEEKRP